MAWQASPDRVLLFGGWNGSYLSETWEYDGIGWIGGAQAPANLEPRYAPVVTYDPGSSGALSYLEAAREMAERGAKPSADPTGHIPKENP